MGGHTRLYDELGVAPTATPQDIKKAYYRLAQLHHPDKGGPHADETKFKVIQGAYDVLKDDQKRRLYDRFGDQGLQWIEGGQMSPMAAAAMNQGIICLLGTLGIILTFLFFVFLTLKIDDSTSLDWGGALWPLWILDSGLALLMLLHVFSLPCALKQIEEHQRQADDARAAGQEVPEGRYPSKRKHVINVVTVSILIVCFIVFTVLLSRKLDGKLDLAWGPVFVPVYIVISVSSYKICFSLSPQAYLDWCQALGVPPNTPGYTYRRYLFNDIASSVRNYTTLLLLIWRVQERFTGTWHMIFIPVYVWYAAGLTMYVMDQWALLKHRGASTAQAVCQIVQGILYVFVPILTQVLLIAEKADGASMSMGVVFIPTWVLLGIGSCIFCFVVASLGDSSMAAGAADAHGQANGANVYASSGTDAAPTSEPAAPGDQVDPVMSDAGDAEAQVTANVDEID